MARLYRIGEVLHQDYDGPEASFEALIPPHVLHEFEKFIIQDNPDESGEKQDSELCESESKTTEKDASDDPTGNEREIGSECENHGEPGGSRYASPDQGNTGERTPQRTPSEKRSGITQ